MRSTLIRTAKRGRPTLPPELRKQRVNLRLRLPPAKQWRRILDHAKYKDTTAFFQQMIDYLVLASEANMSIEKKKLEQKGGGK